MEQPHLLACWRIVLLSCLLLVQFPFGDCRKGTQVAPVTNEDIKDALMSVIHLLHSTQDKLERHEMREKQLGEIVKRALGGLEKRHRGLEPLKGMLQRLDERLAGVETILMQNEERQKLQNIVTNNTVDVLVKSIESLNDKISTRTEPTSATSTVDTATTITNLKNEIHDMKSTLAELKMKFDTQSSQIRKIDDVSTKVYNVLSEKSSDVAVTLEKYENKLTEFNSRATEMHAISYKEPTDYGSQMMTALTEQHTLLEHMANDLKTNAANIKQLPTLGDVTTLANNTLYLIQDVKFDLNSLNDKTTKDISAKLQQMNANFTSYCDTTSKSFSELTDMHKNVYTGIANSYEQLHNEIQALSKIEKVMIQTADNVLDIKKRIEYGIHQILLEVGDLVKVQGKDLNGTVNKRFDDIELTILDNQSDALANLTTKLETEMSQVWRQIGIMYQQLTASTTALDRLQSQTDSYVNGSLTTMDSMTGKVGKITSKMAEVDENLNYLMGRLSLVTHEFNQIKVGLGNALDQIRGSFQVVQNKIKDVGPGPHVIASSAENEVQLTGKNNP